MLRSYNTSSMCDICGEYRVRNPSPSLAFARGSKVMHMLMGEKITNPTQMGSETLQKCLDQMLSLKYSVLLLTYSVSYSDMQYEVHKTHRKLQIMSGYYFSICQTYLLLHVRILSIYYHFRILFSILLRCWLANLTVLREKNKGMSMSKSQTHYI